MNHTDKTIGFATELVPLVLDGSKTFTYRLGDKWDFLQVGDKILTDNSGTGKVFAELEITHKEKGTFGTLRDDREGHEMYRTPEERHATFEKYYKRPIADDEPAIILGFKVVRKINDKNQNAVHIYNKIAEDYAKTYDAIDGEEDLVFLQKFLAALVPKSSILDIGCGTGFSAGFFIQNGMLATGIDLAESMIAIAKRNYPNIPFAVADILEYAPPRPVDAVWAG